MSNPEFNAEAVDAAKTVLAELPTNAITPLNDRQQRSEEIRGIVAAIFDTEHGLLAKSVLNQQQIGAVGAALVFAEKINSTHLARLVHYLLELQISRGGLGRRNLTDVLAAIANREETKESERGWFRRMFGGGF